MYGYSKTGLEQLTGITAIGQSASPTISKFGSGRYKLPADHYMLAWGQLLKKRDKAQAAARLLYSI